MENDNFKLMKMFYDSNTVDIEYLKQVTITKENKYGYITPEEFQKITGKPFITSVSPF